MKVQVIESEVLENTVHPRIIFNVKIDHQKSEMAIVGLDGWKYIQSSTRIAHFIYVKHLLKYCKR
jgi:hypothetical protein